MRHLSTVSSARDMLQLIKLVEEGRIDSAVAVTEQVYPQRTGGIEVTLSVHSIEPRAFAPTDRDQRQGLVLLHLCAEVPDRLPTAVVHVFIVHLLEIQYKKPYY